MKQRTVLGAKTQPALPLIELNELKSIIFGLFPKYRNSPFQFETLWMKCVDALGHACRRLTLELRRATLVTKMKRLRSAEGDFSRRAGLFKYLNGIRGQS